MQASGRALHYRPTSFGDKAVFVYRAKQHMQRPNTAAVSLVAVVLGKHSFRQVVDLVRLRERGSNKRSQAERGAAGAAAGPVCRSSYP